MKIAILGKGGTGKSSISWLFTQYLQTNKSNNILAIDADHNMDLTSCLNYYVQDNEKFFYKSNQTFKQLLGIKQEQKWQVQFDTKSFNHDSIKFTYKPANSFLPNYIFPINSNLDLIVVGLGEEDIMYSGKCSHGLSSPLKYLLPRLELEPNSYLIMDSVAGSDMINYGLYFGLDVHIVVVEGHINSVKVAKQLDDLFIKQGIKAYFILNKFNSVNLLIQEFIQDQNIADRVLGTIPIDINIMQYDYTKVSQETKDNMDQIFQKILTLPKTTTHGLELLKQFEAKKSQYNKSKSLNN